MRAVLRRGEGSAGASQALQFGEGFLVRTLGQGDAALEAAEDQVGGHKGCAKGRSLRAVGADGVVFPQVGFGAEKAAQHPLIADEVIDVETLFGRERLETGDVLVLERGKFVGALADDELRVGIESGF